MATIVLTLSSRSVSTLAHFFNLKLQLFLFKYITWPDSVNTLTPCQSGHLVLNVCGPSIFSISLSSIFFCLDAIIFLVSKRLNIVYQSMVSWLYAVEHLALDIRLVSSSRHLQSALENRTRTKALNPLLLFYKVT